MATATPSHVFVCLESTPDVAVSWNLRSKPEPVDVLIVTSRVPVAVSSAVAGAEPDQILISPASSRVLSVMCLGFLYGVQ